MAKNSYPGMFILSLIVLSSICTGCSPKNSVDPGKLVGIWNRIPDSANQHYFNGKNSIVYMYGAKMEANDYKVINDVLIETDRSTGTKYQYTIVKLTDDSLTLRHIPTDYELHYWKSKSSVIVRRQP